MLPLHVNELFVTFGLSTFLQLLFYIPFFVFNTFVGMFVCLCFGYFLNLCVCLTMSLLAYLSLCRFVFLSLLYGQFVPVPYRII